MSKGTIAVYVISVVLALVAAGAVAISLTHTSHKTAATKTAPPTLEQQKKSNFETAACLAYAFLNNEQYQRTNNGAPVAGYAGDVKQGSGVGCEYVFGTSMSNAQCLRLNMDVHKDFSVKATGFTQLPKSVCHL